MVRLSIVLALLVACGSDDCERMYDKVMSMLPELQKDEKVKGPRVEKGPFVEQCREKMKNASDEDRQVMKCMLDANDPDAMERCATGGRSLSYLKKKKKVEPEVELDKLTRGAKAAFNARSVFPRGKAATLPSKPCCEGSGAKCPVDAGAWRRDPIWSALDFSIDEPNRFQYSYESVDGRTATITAVGDLDCDTVPIKYTLRLESMDNLPTATIEAPPPGAD